MVFNLFHQAEFFQLFNGFPARRLRIHPRERRIFIEGGILVQNINHRQVVALADFKVVKVMRRSNLNRTGSLFRIGMVIGDNRYRTIDNRQNRIFTNQMFQFFIFFGNGYRGIAEHGFGTGGGNVYEFARFVFNRIFVVIHFADSFFLNNFQIGNGGHKFGIPVDQFFGFVNQAVFIHIDKDFANRAA